VDTSTLVVGVVTVVFVVGVAAVARAWGEPRRAGRPEDSAAPTLRGAPPT